MQTYAEMITKLVNAVNIKTKLDKCISISASENLLSILPCLPFNIVSHWKEFVNFLLRAFLAFNNKYLLAEWIIDKCIFASMYHRWVIWVDEWSEKYNWKYVSLRFYGCTTISLLVLSLVAIVVVFTRKIHLIFMR